MKLYNIWPFAPGFFRLACFEIHTCCNIYHFLPVHWLIVVHPMDRPNFWFILHQQMDIWIISSFYLLFQILSIIYFGHFWTLNSVLLNYVAILLPVLCYLDYCCFVLSFEIRKYNFVLLSQHFVVDSVLWIFT